MSFFAALESVMVKLAAFGGRALRDRLWYVFLFLMLVNLIEHYLATVTGGAVTYAAGLAFENGASAFAGPAALFVIYVLYVIARPSEAGPNRYGPKPHEVPQ